MLKGVRFSFLSSFLSLARKNVFVFFRSAFSPAFFNALTFFRFLVLPGLDGLKPVGAFFSLPHRSGALVALSVCRKRNDPGLFFYSVFFQLAKFPSFF